jgi:hypothetical protein
VSAWISSARWRLPRGLLRGVRIASRYVLVTVALSEPSRLGFHEHCIDHAELFTVAPLWVARWPSLRDMHTREFPSTIVRNVFGE